MGRMNQKYFAETVAECSQAMLSDVLAGKRHFSCRRAERVAEALGTDPLLWMKSSTPVEERRKKRREAWENSRRRRS